MKIGTALERAQEISLLVLNVWEGHQGLIPHYQKKKNPWRLSKYLKRARDSTKSIKPEISLVSTFVMALKGI